MPTKANFIGATYGRLLIVGDSPDTVHPSGKRTRTVLCRCSCGKEKVIPLPHIRAGSSTSCGCYRIESIKRVNTKHGATVGLSEGDKIQPEYQSWAALKARCRKGGHKLYAGRGLRVCARWLESFSNFMEDMGPRPTLEHSIDRIDNDKGYSPENCRWSTKKEQGRNRRTNRRISYRGSTKAMSAWCEETGIRYPVAYKRLRKGWTLFQALFTPLKHKRLPDDCSCIELQKDA